MTEIYLYVEYTRVGKYTKGNIYFGVGSILVSRDVPKMPTISMTVFFEAENSHDN